MKKVFLLFLLCICLFSTFSCDTSQEKTPELPAGTQQGGDELRDEKPGTPPDDGWTGDIVLPR